MKASNGLGSSRSILLNDDDDRIELAGQYFAGSVIEQAVRDWRKAKASGFITREGTIDATMIQAYYKNSSNHKLPTYFDGPADLETLVTFFHGGGLEVWMTFGDLDIDPDIIVAGLDCVPARKAKIGHLMNNEYQESGSYYVDMEGRTLCPPPVRNLFPVAAAQRCPFPHLYYLFEEIWPPCRLCGPSRPFFN